MRPLHSYEAEQSVLGALLLSNAAIDNVGDLRDEDFYVGAHKRLFSTIRGLISDGRPADAVTLSAELERSGWLEDVGGMAYVGALLEAVPTAATIRQYADIVVDRRIDRDISAAAEKMAALAHGGGPAAERMAEAQKLVFDLAEVSGDEDGVAIGAAAAGFLEILTERHEAGTQITGYASGLSDLDAKLCGFQPGDLIIVAGRPSMGKTTAAMQFALHGAKAGKVVQVYSMEMARHQLVERAVSNLGKINSHTLRTGSLQGEDWEKLTAALSMIHEMPLVIDDSPALSPERMLARSRRLKRKRGRLDLVVVDYLQLMAGAGDNRNEQISSLTRGLKLMARELNCPVILLSQLSRKCEERTDKRPMMSDLRDSGAIEQDADVILMLYRDEVYNPDTRDKGLCEILVRKQRMGETGDIAATWIGEFNALADTEWKRAPAPTPMRGRPRDVEFHA